MAPTAPPASANLRSSVTALGVGRTTGEEAVHALHRALRRRRLEARLRGLTPPSRPVRELERALGSWRDRTLFRATLRQVEPARLRPRERAWKRAVYRRALAEERQARAEALAAARRAARDASLAAARPTRGRGTGPRAARARRGLRAALERASDRLSARRAHELRKEIRRAGFLEELLAGAGDRPARPPAVRRLVAALGRLHDLDVALEHLERYPRGGARWRARLVRERRRRAQELRPALRSRAVARFVRGA